MVDKVDFKERRRDKLELYKQVVDAGGIPAKNNMFHCFQHNDKTASAWIRKSKEGFWYFRCFTCNFWMDVWDLEAKNRGLSLQELLKERVGSVPAPEQKYHYKSIEEIIESLDYIAIEQIDPYTNPESNNIDLLVIRYLPRGGNKKLFSQSHQTDGGFIKKRPAGMLPIFNRARVAESDTVIFVEGEKCVRALQNIGFTATTGSGGSSNASVHDLSPLSGKTVFLWADFDTPGKAYMEAIRDRLLELDPVPTIYIINVDELELPSGGDVVDLVEKTKSEGGTENDCKLQIEALLAEATESNRLGSFETLLDDMREGRRQNLPINGFPLLTSEAMTLLNQQISVVYGNAGFGKTLFVGKLSDDLALVGHKVARLQLEDDLPKHLLRTFAQQSGRSELTNPEFHKNNPRESHALYKQYQPVLDAVAATIVADETKEWTVTTILEWLEQQLKAGKTLSIVDPVSVVMTEKVWLESNKLMWGTKKLLRQYPMSRVLFVTHPNSEGEVSGGQAYKRFCHNLLILNKFKAPKNFMVLKADGTEEAIQAQASIGIVKTRDGRGSGLEIAIKLNSSNICIEELGVITKELKDTPAPRGKYTGRDLEAENDDMVIPF